MARANCCTIATIGLQHYHSGAAKLPPRYNARLFYERRTIVDVSEILAGLNERQREAVTHPARALRVRCSARWGSCGWGLFTAFATASCAVTRR